jgi:hypothetical protein
MSVVGTEGTRTQVILGIMMDAYVKYDSFIVHAIRPLQKEKC